jgi:hypothetical protein
LKEWLMPTAGDEFGQVINSAQRVAVLTEQTLAPLLLAMTGWRPEFRAIMLRAVGRRALALAAEAENTKSQDA